MPEQTPSTLNHFAQFRYADAFFLLPQEQKREIHRDWLECLQLAAKKVDVYQIYPSLMSADFLVWSAEEYEQPAAAEEFFTRFARSTNRFRAWMQPIHTYWGFTKPSQYTKTRSTQEIDPFAETRQPYLVMYPFSKTADWYLMSREARQGMMNEHIRIGKNYPEITQLLLYSFGIQDQEFIVVYETADLKMFSDLVYELRDSEARRYTLRDTPLLSAVYHPAAETLALFE